MRRRASAFIMLGQRRRRWASNIITLVQLFVFTGIWYQSPLWPDFMQGISVSRRQHNEKHFKVYADGMKYGRIWGNNSVKLNDLDLVVLSKILTQQLEQPNPYTFMQDVWLPTK